MRLTALVELNPEHGLQWDDDCVRWRGWRLQALVLAREAWDCEWIVNRALSQAD